MGLIDFVLGLSGRPQPKCDYCRKCQSFSYEMAKWRDRFTTYVRQPDYRGFPCRYIPDGKGGCLKYDPYVPQRVFLFDIFSKGVFPGPGSVVICDLRFFISPLAFEHSGIADGCGNIIHRDGEGYLAKVSPSTFIARLNGWNGTLSIYVACKGEEPIVSAEALERANLALEDPEQCRGYDLFEKNCHQFAQYCYTGKTDKSFTFGSLETMLAKEFGLDNWRMWDINPFEE